METYGPHRSPVQHAVLVSLSKSVNINLFLKQKTQISFFLKIYIKRCLLFRTPYHILSKMYQLLPKTKIKNEKIYNY